jgi:uncharacterized protein
MSETRGLVRHTSLDVLRGFAVMGILAMNIVAFAMPEWAYITPKAYGGETFAEQAAWFVFYVLVDGKMRGLFSLLFGASMMLIIDRAEAKGESAKKIHYSRMLWLALFGLFHYFFIWFGDILFLYAAIGCIAFLFRNWEPRRLIKWALIIFGIMLVFWGLQFIGMQVLQMLATAPGADPALVKTYREMLDSGDFSFNVADELARHRGSYWGIVAHKLAEWHNPLVAVLQGLGETLPLMMLGMAMKKNGFLTGEWIEADYRRWINRLLLPGLILNALVAAMVAMAGFDLITSLAAFMSWNAIPRLMLTIAYAGLLILLAKRLQGSAFLERVAAAGRAAFSNYLGTSIVMTTIFYGYGLGLYGHVSRIGLWAFVLGAWVVMLLWSKPWLDRFHYGPLEWLWRSLARMQVQPLRK